MNIRNLKKRFFVITIYRLQTRFEKPTLVLVCIELISLKWLKLFTTSATSCTL